MFYVLTDLRFSGMPGTSILQISVELTIKCKC